MTQVLKSGIAQALSRPITPEAEAGIDAYLASLTAWNPKLNLVSRASDALSEQLEQHVLDSIRPLPELIARIGSGSRTLIDVGSGGGFPGVVLAAIMPQWHITLVERSARKCGFLRNVALGRPNLTVHEGSPATLAAEPGRGPAAGPSYAVMRAVCSIDHPLVIETLEVLSDPARLFMYKGRRQRIEEDLAQAQTRYPELNAEIIGPLSGPTDEGSERHLVELCAQAS